MGSNVSELKGFLVPKGDMEYSIEEHICRVRTLIRLETEKIEPDNCLVAVLCDAVALALWVEGEGK